jgi:cation transporter-like permease
VVSRVAVLRDPLFRLGWQDLLAYNVLQHLSTIAGALALTLTYLGWLRRQPKVDSVSGGDRVRYLAIIGAAVASLIVAFVGAHRVSLAYTGEHAFRTLVVQTAIQAVSVLAVVLLVYSAIYIVRKRIA